MWARSPSVPGSSDRCRDSSGRRFQVWGTNWPTSTRGPYWDARSQTGRSPQAMPLDTPLQELRVKVEPGRGHSQMDRLPAVHPSGLQPWELPVRRNWQEELQRWRVMAARKKEAPRQGHWTAESKEWDTDPGLDSHQGHEGKEELQSKGRSPSGCQPRRRPSSLLLLRLDGLPWPWTAFPKRP